MSTAPIEFPPPVDSAKEFVGPPVDPEDERIEVGVAIVGGGWIGLEVAADARQRGTNVTVVEAAELPLPGRHAPPGRHRVIP